MSTTLLEVVNQALNELGHLAVTEVTNQPDALLLSQKLAIGLPLLLLKTDWNFAIVYRSDNTPITQNFSPQYNYSYQLPADYGRMDRFYNQYNPWRIVDGLLLSNQLPASYYYVSNNVDYSAISVTFSYALSLWAASQACDALTNNDALTRKLLFKYDAALKDAMVENDQERLITTMPHNDYDRQSYV